MIFYKNKLNKFVFFYLLFNLSVCYSDEYVNYLELLKNNNKLLLELSINSLQKDISDDADSEGYYVAIINSLANSLEGDGLEFIEQWILSGEESYLPYLLKGVYFANKGWRSRGKSYSRQTPKEQFKQMEADFSVAEAMLLKAIELNPYVINAYSELIAVYFSLKKYGNKAEKIHDKGVAYNKNSVEIRVRYLAFLFPKWRVEVERRSNYIERVEKLAKENPRMNEVLIDNYIQMAEYITDYKKSMTLYSASFKYGYRCRTHVSRALRKFNFKYYTYALKDLNELIEKCPKNSSAYLIKARTVHKLDDVEEAMKNFGIALSLNPDAPHIIGTRGYVYYREKNYQQAVSDLSRAIERDKGTAWMWENRAKSYRKLKQYDKAIYDFGKAIQLNPGNISNYRLRGYCYKKLQQYNLALKDYDAGLLVDKKNVKLLMQRAKLNNNVFSDQGAAINDLEYLIKLDPSNKKAMKFLYKIKARKT